MLVLYPDVAFLLNGGLDYLVLCATVRLLGFPKRQKRLLLAAALGGLYGALAMLPPLSAALFSLPAKLTASLLMALIAFGRDRHFLRYYFLFLVSSCVLSGAVTAVTAICWRWESPLLIFMLSGLFCAFTLSVVFHRGAQAAAMGRLLEAQLELKGRQVRLTLYHDTGNTLRDPASGKAVCVVYQKALEPLLRGESISYYQIPYRSLGQENGALTCFTCDRLTIGGTCWISQPIGISPAPLTEGGGYVGLWGGEWKGENLHEVGLDSAAAPLAGKTGDCAPRPCALHRRQRYAPAAAAEGGGGRPAGAAGAGGAGGPADAD